MEKGILYITGKGVLDEEQKRALYLHVAGMDVRENYFIHLFQKIMQEGEETIYQLGRLHQRAINCEFGENENDYIREVIDKCYLSKLC